MQLFVALKCILNFVANDVRESVRTYSCSIVPAVVSSHWRVNGLILKIFCAKIQLP